MTITILKWRKFHPRKDVEKPTWFAMSNTLIGDPDFYSFSPGELLAWIYLLSQASQKNSDVVHINFEHADRACRIKKKDVLSAIKKLEEKQIVIADVTPTSRQLHADVTPTTRYITVQDNTEQNSTEQTTFSSDLRKPQVIGCIDELRFSAFCENLLDGAKPDSQRAWLRLYPEPDFLEREFLKMEEWLARNQKKRPISPLGVGRFVSSWLSRGWDDYRKKIQTNPQGFGDFKTSAREFLKNKVSQDEAERILDELS